MTDPVSRYEFEDLKSRVMANAQRIDDIDRHGTRGVAVLSLQIQELAKDIAGHEKIHEQDVGRHVDSRRWLLAFAVALVAAIDGPIVSVLLAFHH